MGLRINTNIPALRALRFVQLHDRALSTSLERLSSGLRINRGADDPSGLIISEQLSGQLAMLRQAQENSQNAQNLLSVADAALSELARLLSSIQESVVFVLNGTATADQIMAEQSVVDNTIAAIDRIASTTRYGDRGLVNGTASFELVSDRPAAVNDLKVRSVFIVAGQTYKEFELTVPTAPERAAIQFDYATVITSGTVIRLTGPRGTEDVSLAVGAQAQDIARAINSVAGYTGVYASSSSATPNTVILRSEEFGSAQMVKIEILSGAISGTGANDITVTIDGSVVHTGAVDGPLDPGELFSDTGEDGVVQFEGVNFTGIGRKFSVLTRSAYFIFSLDPDMIDDGTITDGYAIPAFRIGTGGLNFQLNEMPYPSDMISVGIEPVFTSFLGFEPIRAKIDEATTGGEGPTVTIYKGGFVRSIKTGGGNDLLTNPKNAHEIVRQAITQVSSLRGYIGSVVAGMIQPNVAQLSIHIENLSSALSYIRDLDFAQEITNFTKLNILYQATIASVASANMLPQAVLALLGG